MQRKNLIILISLILLSILLFLYISNKATVSSFTHDESFTYNHYVHESFMDIISNKDSYTNNHLLNTLCMKYSEIIFGSSEIALRLPNLLMLLVFFAYTWLLFRKNNPVVRISIFILMFSNTYLIDFFGLARGYGMSIGFMVMSLYHLITAFNSTKNYHLILFNISALLAILSNYTLLDFYVAALFVFNLIKFIECRFIFHEKFAFFKINKVNIILFIVSFLILYEPLRRAIKYNSFDFGGKEGFMSNTVTTLLYQTFPRVNLNSVELLLLKILILFFVLLSFGVIVQKSIRANKEFFRNSKALIMVNLILLTISIITIIQHYLFKTDYLIGRFALFLLPLFILNIGFLYEYLLKIRYPIILHTVAVLVAILSVINFYSNANQYSCAEWGFDMNTKNMINDLEKAYIADALRDRTTPPQIKLGINWLFEPTINFYRTTKNLKWLKEVNRDGFKDKYDFYYIFTPDTLGLNHNNVINTYKGSNTILAK